MTRSRLTIVLASALLVLPVAALPTTSASGAPATCASAGDDVNVWNADKGMWSDYTNWSLSAVPVAGDSRRSVCIPDGVAVVLDVERVDLLRLELGRGSTLKMNQRTALYLYGGEDQESLTRLGSVVKVNGATLGGPGQLHVIGTVEVSSTDETTARLTSGDGGGTGRMVVGDDGTLDILGEQDARLSGDYTVVVHGRARLPERAGLLADPGTRFELQKHLADDGGVGRFVIKNERGYFAPEGASALSEFVNNGKIVKRNTGPDSKSAITADYSGEGEVRIRTGYLVVPEDADVEVQVASGAAVGSGLCINTDDRSCTTQTTPEEPQFASLRVPKAADVFADVDVDIREVAGVPDDKTLGKRILVHADDIVTSDADPVVIELRYDQDLLGGRAPDLDKLQVARLSASGEWTDLPDCIGAALPSGPDVFGCMDRRKWQTRRDGRDVILVVRTTRTSQWISRWIPH